MDTYPYKIITVRHPTAPCNIAVYVTETGISAVTENQYYHTENHAYNVRDNSPNNHYAAVWGYLARALACELAEIRDQVELTHVKTPTQRRLDAVNQITHEDAKLWTPKNQ